MYMPMWNLHVSIFVISNKILGRKLFGGSRKKDLGLTIIFPSIPPNQTFSKKFSLLIFYLTFFSFLFFILPKIHSTKHNLNKGSLEIDFL